jgi:hypothetical protein
MRTSKYAPHPNNTRTTIHPNSPTNKNTMSEHTDPLLNYTPHEQSVTETRIKARSTYYTTPCSAINTSQPTLYHTTQNSDTCHTITPHRHKSHKVIGTHMDIHNTTGKEKASQQKSTAKTTRYSLLQFYRTHPQQLHAHPAPGNTPLLQVDKPTANITVVGDTAHANANRHPSPGPRQAAPSPRYHTIYA